MTRKIIISIFMMLTALEGLSVAHADPVSPYYRITDLGTLGGRNSWTLSNDWVERARGLILASALNDQILGPAINGQGSIIGYSETRNGSVEPFLWNDGKMRPLRYLSKRETAGWSMNASMLSPCFLIGINDRGHILGMASVKRAMKVRAFLTDGTQLQPLDKLNIPIALIIAFNDRDEFFCTDYPHRTPNVLQWQPGKLSIAKQYAGISSDFQEDLFGPSGLNDVGQAVGSDQFAHQAEGDARWYAVLWNKGKLQNMSVAKGYESSVAYRVNDRGQAIGINSYVATSKGKHLSLDNFVTLRQSHQPVEEHCTGFVWSQGIMHLLPTLSQHRLTLPIALNDNGDIVGMVGESRSASGLAVLWRQGKVYDLNKLIAPNSPWLLRETAGINNRGQIVATGFSKKGKSCNHVLLLTPTKWPAIN